MKNQLESFLRGEETGFDLIIAYHDLHGLWGGVKMIIRCSCIGVIASGECHEHALGSQQPEKHKTEISPSQLEELIDLLIRLEAWEQKRQSECLCLTKVGLLSR
jgi:hypothetical protein